MKALVRKLARVKKRKLVTRAVAAGLAAWALKYGRINQTTDLPINSSQEIQTINTQTTSRETESSFTVLVSDQYSYQDSNKSLTGQKSELTYSQEELDALGLGNVDKKVTLVVGMPVPHFSQQELVIRQKSSNRLIQESNVPMNVKTHPKIVLIKMKSDLTNPKWINKFIISVRGGEERDEALIRSILSKAGESNLDLPSNS